MKPMTFCHLLWVNGPPNTGSKYNWSEHTYFSVPLRGSQANANIDNFSIFLNNILIIFHALKATFSMTAFVLYFLFGFINANINIGDVIMYLKHYYAAFSHPIRIPKQHM